MEPRDRLEDECQPDRAGMSGGARPLKGLCSAAERVATEWEGVEGAHPYHSLKDGPQSVPSATVHPPLFRQWLPLERVSLALLSSLPPSYLLFSLHSIIPSPLLAPSSSCSPTCLPLLLFPSPTPSSIHQHPDKG